MRFHWTSVMGIVTASVLALAGCAPAAGTPEPAITPVSTTTPAEVQPSATPQPTKDPFPGWTTYANPTLGLSFRYPATWYGPDVYEFEGGVRLEVGSDVVYPYGTGPEDRKPGASNAYSIVIQYTLNTSGMTLEQYRAEQPWLNDYLAVLDLHDGESLTTDRSLITRERGLTLGRFTGVEFTTTLPETAQTDHVYMRTAFLMDDGLNVVQIMGSPNNVEVTDPATWRAAFAAVDSANQPIFDELAGSIQVP